MIRRKEKSAEEKAADKAWWDETLTLSKIIDVRDIPSFLKARHLDGFFGNSSSISDLCEYFKKQEFSGGSEMDIIYKTFLNLKNIKEGRD